MTPIHLAGPADDLRALLAAAGFAFADDPTRAAVVVLAVDDTRPAVARTRVWRAELGDHRVPILWVLPSPVWVAVGLDAGADVCLARPVDPGVLVAQVRALARLGEAAGRVAARADEVRGLTDHLRTVYDRAEADARLVRQVQLAGLPRRLPTLGPVRFAVSGPPGWFDVVRLDETHAGFWVADPGTDGVVGLAIRQAVVGREVTDAGARLVPPAEVLARVNRTLLALDLDPRPLAGLAYGLIDAAGRVTLARAGVPPAVHHPADGPPREWPGPGPFLGAFDATFDAHEDRLGPGDRLVLTGYGGDGATVLTVEVTA